MKSKPTTLQMRLAVNDLLLEMLPDTITVKEVTDMAIVMTTHIKSKWLPIVTDKIYEVKENPNKEL